MNLKPVYYYIDGVLAGRRPALAKTLTLIESVHPAHRRLVYEILDRLLPHTGKAVRLGITGVPGVGKSTFIESFGMQLIAKGHKVAVLAIDPSSTRSGGSVLGDKTRMEQLCVEPNAFIRPSPSGGNLGGVARRTREAMLVCEAAGFDVVLIETVGVGQSETTVASMVDFFLVLMLAGAGDQLQGIKKGVLEIADAIAINKADGDNIERARQAKQDYEAALHLLNPISPNWLPPVLTCSALESDGLAEIWETICDHHRIFAASGEMEMKRKRQSLDWMWRLVEDQLKERFYANYAVQAMLPQLVQRVEDGTMVATHAAQQLLAVQCHEHGTFGRHCSECPEIGRPTEITYPVHQRNQET